MKTTKTKRVYEKLKKDFASRYTPKVVKPYEFWGKVVKVIDGDTLDIEIELGFEIKAKHRFRLIGVDAPEIRGVKKDSREYKEGKKALEYLEQIIPPGTWVEVRTYAKRREIYGRWLCEIFINGLNLNEDVIKKGYAEVYKA
ncbi:MAG: thermonuclease family protein [Candidatus Helarchaeota archaeon]|nr:thermonuclease family protein [Candidatus Helarchaeota archaeon]